MWFTSCLCIYTSLSFTPTPTSTPFLTLYPLHRQPFLLWTFLFPMKLFSCANWTLRVFCIDFCLCSYSYHYFVKHVRCLIMKEILQEKTFHSGVKLTWFWTGFCLLLGSVNLGKSSELLEPLWLKLWLGVIIPTVWVSSHVYVQDTAEKSTWSSKVTAVVTTTIIITITEKWH